jgi:adenosylcobyric acid synthase
MRSRGLDAAIEQHARVSLVVGICGGMQILGETITDPRGMEHEGSVAGLGLLAIQTNMQADKVTRTARGMMATAVLFGQPITDCQLSGYEIHIGQTSYQPEAKHFAVLSSESGPSDMSTDGCVSTDTHVFGTYLHGIFDEDSFRHEFLRAARCFHGLSVPYELHLWKQLREDSLNRLARAVEDALDMDAIFGWAGLSYKSTRAKNRTHLREGAVR